MNAAQIFSPQAVVTLLAAGVVIFVAVMLTRHIMQRGQEAIREILTVSTGIICVCLVGLSRATILGPWALWAGFGGVVALLMFHVVRRSNIRTTGLLLLIVGSSCFMFYGLWLLIGLLLFFLACGLSAPIARRHGWGAEGRLTRHLTRPRFEDESRKAT